MINRVPLDRLELPDSLLLSREDEVLFVRVDRPAKRNALNDELVLGLERIFSNVPEGVGVAVLYGAGAHFSAGLDLNEIGDHGVIEGVHHSRMWHRAMNTIQFGAVPVVAVLQGAVIGGGLELACAAHIRVAEPSTYFALPEGQRGIFMGGGGSVRVPRLIGVARMTDMMLTGRVVRAEEGLQIGLAQYLVEEGQGLAKATELARGMAGNAAMTNYAVMHVLPRIADLGQDPGLMMEALAASLAQSTPEAKDRLDQFLTGRAKKVGDE
jgi:enoyl-CoA hydratase/carnithine racemase